MIIQKVLKMVFFVVFLGWLMIWIMLPTKTYKNKWTPNLQMKLDSTYFEGQGINLLLLTFPVMFIAAFGCVYLHLQRKSEKLYTKSASKTGRLAFLRRPVLVMPTLGIVTLTELAFVAMFIALLIWSLANYIYISYSGHLHMDKGVEVWQAKFRSVSLRLGYVGNICWAFLFFPVTRGSSILPLVGLTSESSIKYHIWLGHLSNLLFLLHTIGFIIYWGITHQMSLMLEWSSTWVSNVAGEIAMVFAAAMWITSFRPIRRKMFEVFFYTHQLYALYIIFYVLHVGAAYFCMIIPGIFLFVIDRHLRFLQSRQRVRLLAARLLPSSMIELNFAKSPEVKYHPTSIMFVNIPSISKLQWHPFTVTSSSNMEPDRLSVAIKCQGSWSRRLFESLSSFSSSSLDHLQVSVEGPYGPSSSQFLRHETLVMVSGGSGITPFISIIREIIHQTNQQQTDTAASSKLPNVLLICAFKTSADLAILDLLLPLSLDPSSRFSPQLHLRIEAYVTRDHHQQLDPAQKLIQTTWFKPDPLDSPITPALGSNSWLWLGAIIASSFAMFLLLLGIVTRYYIYPIEHGDDGNYHFSYWTLWEMFLMCACVFLASSGVFLWRKKGATAGGRQVKSMEIPTPTASPGSWFSNVEERGVESVPHQSLVEATNVHYGGRPDLKKSLSECKGPDTGVLVCGPTEMRHEVAKICASGLGENLHFESISFNW
ncbi:ferric reduction oxidase 4-like [Eucalyptus grandis]|uniref:ferric reduction oxidase 4-like n=1 Tax=Eucalyptus grandis TaxID=71139 RepID=UPI00192E9CD6|nr:ferric reduction oxidase 4-like [Eucalyptus grandis]